MECDCCCIQYEHVNICVNNHRVCDLCRLLTNIECIYCNPLNNENIIVIDDNSQNEYEVNHNNREYMQRHNLLYQYHQLYLIIRSTSVKQHLINLVCFSIFILYLLYINKLVQYLLYMLNSHDYPYDVSWTSFSIDQILMNLGILCLFYVYSKICCCIE